MPEEINIRQKITERDDIADILGLIPSWMISAVVWYFFTKIILDRFTDKKPGTEINAAIIVSDIAGVTFPAGVALAAQIDVTLTALGILTTDLGPEFTKLLGPEFTKFITGWIKRFT